MAIFQLSGDIQAFLLRVTASLERIDGAVSEAQLLIRNANAAVTEVRQTLAGARAGMAQDKRS